MVEEYRPAVCQSRQLQFKCDCVRPPASRPDARHPAVSIRVPGVASQNRMKVSIPASSIVILISFARLRCLVRLRSGSCRRPGRKPLRAFLRAGLNAEVPVFSVHGCLLSSRRFSFIGCRALPDRPLRRLRGLTFAAQPRQARVDPVELFGDTDLLIPSASADFVRSPRRNISL